MINKMRSQALAIVGIILGITAISMNFVRTRKEIVYVDAQRLVTGYRGAVEARKQFEAKTTGWQKNVDTLRVELEAKIATYSSSQNKMSPKEKALMEELLQTKQDELVRYQQVVGERLKKEDQELSQKVMSNVNTFVKRYGESKGYAIIMAATQYGNIVYAEDYTDITNEVLSGLNLEYAN